MSVIKPAKSFSDIRAYFEKKVDKSPELVKFVRRGSVTFDPVDFSVNLNVSDSCDLLLGVTQSAPTSPSTSNFNCRQTASTMMPATKKVMAGIRGLSEAAGDLVLGTPASAMPPPATPAPLKVTLTPAHFNPKSAASPAPAAPPPATPASATSKSPASAPPTTLQDTPLQATPLQDTPLSQAGDWNTKFDEDQFNLHSNPDGIPNFISVSDDHFVITNNMEADDPTDLVDFPPLSVNLISPPLAQRVKSARQAVRLAAEASREAAVKSGAKGPGAGSGAKGPGTGHGGAKRPLPFTSPEEGNRGKSSKSSGTASEAEDCTMEDSDHSTADHSTVKKKGRPTKTMKTNSKRSTQSAGDWVPRAAFDALRARVEKMHQEQMSYMSQLTAALQESVKSGDEHNRVLADHQQKLESLREESSSIQFAHNSTATEVVLIHNSVRALQTDNSTMKSWRTSMDVAMKNMQASLKNRLTITDGAPGEPSDDTASAFFIGGIPALREWYQDPQADPAEIINWILRETSMYCTMDRMQTADNEAKGNRMAARAMVVVMRSASKKKEAIIRIKRWLAKEGIARGVTVMDCFPSSSREQAKSLGKYALDMRREGIFLQYRIINREGTPILQTKDQSGAYRDEEVTEEQLAAHNIIQQQPMDTEEIVTIPPQAAPNTSTTAASGANTAPVGAQQQKKTSREQPPAHLPLPTPSNNQRTTTNQQHQGGAYRKQPVVPQPMGNNRGGSNRQQHTNIRRPVNNQQQQHRSSQQHQTWHQRSHHFQPQRVYSTEQQYPYVVQQPQPLMQHLPLYMMDQQGHEQQQYYNPQQLHFRSGRNSGRNSVERR